MKYFIGILIIIYLVYLVHKTSPSNNTVINTSTVNNTNAISTATLPISNQATSPTIFQRLNDFLQNPLNGQKLAALINPNLLVAHLTPIAVLSNGSIISAPDQITDSISKKISKIDSSGASTVVQQQQLLSGLQQGIIPDASFSLDNNSPGGTLASDNINAETNINIDPIRTAPISGGADFGGEFGGDFFSGGGVAGSGNISNFIEHFV